MSAAVRDHLLAGEGPLPDAAEAAGTGTDLAAVCSDEDLQLALAMCYELHYRGFDDVDDALEWDPALLIFRTALERGLETAVRSVRAGVEDPAPDESVDVALRRVIDSDNSPSLSRWLMRHGTRDDFAYYLEQRSVYHLREADAHTFGIPRLHGRAKAAMVEIQSDEYGGGRPAQMHSAMYAASMRELGLDDTYGAHWESATGPAFAVVNLMSLFGLNRRLRGALAGHLAALEMTSTMPNRRLSNGLRRIGASDLARAYFEEHVEADAVHEQIASVDLCGALVREEPALREDVLLGAAAYLAVDGVFAEDLITRFEQRRAGDRQETAGPLAADREGAA